MILLRNTPKHWAFSFIDAILTLAGYVTNRTINTGHKSLETDLSNGKKYICIPRSFLVINVCDQGKTLCSPCIFVPLDRRLNVPSWHNSISCINKPSTLENTFPVPYIVYSPSGEKISQRVLEGCVDNRLGFG